MDYPSISHADVEPSSLYFDAPFSPPLYFPDAGHSELDPFNFDAQRLSPPDVLTPSSSTDSSDSADLLPGCSADEQSLTFSSLPSPALSPQSAISLFAAPLSLSHTLVPSTPTSSSTSLQAQPALPIDLIFPTLPTTLPKPKRTRTNLSHLSTTERLQHKRARHRQIDATRREREKAAVRRLRLLVEEMTGTGVGGGGEEEREREMEGDEDGDGVLGNKTDVLESGITLIEQLRDLCATMQSDGKPIGTKLTRFPRSMTINAPASCPSIIHLLPPATSTLVAHLDRSQTLRTSTAVSSPICSMMILFPGAVVMDVSRSFLDFSGYTEQQLMHSRMNPWYLPPGSEHHTICPLLVDGKDERTGRVTKLVGQYGACKADMGELIKGERGRLDVDWRYRLANGRLMETKTTGWMEDKDTQEEVSIEFTDETGHTHTWRSHRTLIRMVFARQDSVLIDDDETTSVRPPTWQTTEVRNGRRTQVFVRPLVECGGRKRRPTD